MAVVRSNHPSESPATRIEGDPFRQRSEKFNASRLKGECRGRDDSTNDNKKRHRFVLEEYFSKDENIWQSVNSAMSNPTGYSSR